VAAMPNRPAPRSHASWSVSSSRCLALRLVVVATTCLGSASCTSAETGTLSGTAEPCPGASGHAAAGAVVDVSIDSEGHIVQTLSLSSPYSFTLALTPGRYEVAALDDTQAIANVAAGQTASVALLSTCG
jgi:hypothetical protein